MGLKMMEDEDIHMPTVPSGPSTGAASSQNPPQGAPLQDLIAEKQRIEDELEALSGVLDSHSVNMNTGLTTFDGYPRDDIDVAQIRTTRARIIRIRNDYKSIMSGIEKGLHEYHAASKAETLATANRTANGATISTQQQDSSPAPLDPAFARVNNVVSASPAETAGLRIGDVVRNFGSVNWVNHDGLRKLAEVVQRNEGVSDRDYFGIILRSFVLISIAEEHSSQGPAAE
ncbi:putative 26S proteasome regulatory subunit [Agyrium rufum]|nr:putative 26S proteasome regulatory subunit [Agyrium rufum]